MNRRPTVTITFAQSLDGRMATGSGQSQWISGPETLNLAQNLRNDHQVIMVGIGTVLADNPRLTCRLPGGRSPVRAILDSRLRIPPDSHVASPAAGSNTMVFTGPHPDPATSQKLEAAGVEILPGPLTRGGTVDLGRVLAELADRGLDSILVEGGPTVITSFVSQSLWDRMVAVIAPVIIGAGTETVGDLGTLSLTDAHRVTPVRVYQAGKDIVWELHSNEN